MYVCRYVTQHYRMNLSEHLHIIAQSTNATDCTTSWFCYGHAHQDLRISQLSHCCNEPLQYHSTLSPIGIRRSLICLNLKGLSSHKWHPYPCHLEPFTGGRDWLPHMHSFSSSLHETAGWMWTVEVYHTDAPFMEARYVLWIVTATGQLNLN